MHVRRRRKQINGEPTLKATMMRFWDMELEAIHWALRSSNGPPSWRWSCHRIPLSTHSSAACLPCPFTNKGSPPEYSLVGAILSLSSKLNLLWPCYQLLYFVFALAGSLSSSILSNLFITSHSRPFQCDLDRLLFSFVQKEFNRILSHFSGF